jgi:hypothetical protein
MFLLIHTSRATLVLVGRKGNSFLESGYVYAPYVPLQVTPTIFGVKTSYHVRVS